MAKRTDLPATGAIPDESAPQPGTRAWLLLDGGFGRVVAVGQGGLMCRVRLERTGETVERPGCELLRLADDGNDR
jgi:hypothetical protein